MSRKNTTWLKEIRKGLALFLSAAMVATALPQAAFADEVPVIDASEEAAVDAEQQTEELQTEDTQAEDADDGADLQSVSSDTTDENAADETEDADAADASEQSTEETPEAADEEDTLSAEHLTTTEDDGAGNLIFTDSISDLVATVEDGEEGDVYYGTVGDSGAYATVLYVNTDKEVTISMKSGVSSTTDVICAAPYADSDKSRNIVLENVVIDRSEEEVFFQWVYVVGNSLDGTRRMLLTALSTEDPTRGWVNLTLRGQNVLRGPKSSNAAESNTGYSYTPTVYDMIAGIRVGNLSVDGNGSLEVSGKDYGMKIRGSFDVDGGYIKAQGGDYGARADISASTWNVRGGFFAKGSLEEKTVYGKNIFAGTLNNGKIAYCEMTANPDEASKTEYPYFVRRTDEAEEFLSGCLAREALGKVDESYRNAYDIGLTCLDAYNGGGSVNINYGKNYGFDMSQSLAIVHALQNDHPEYWWLWIDKTGPGSRGAEIVLENSYTAAVVESKREEFEKAVEEVERKSGITDNMTQLQKAYVLYQALEAHVSYNLNYIDQSSNSAFTEQKAVCDGYAKAYMLLLQRAGIPASYIEGWGTPGGSGGGMHAWVVMRFDTGNQYYCDPTWDDGGASANFTWFMTNAAGISKWHEAHWEDMGYEIATTANDALAVPTSTVSLTGNASAGGKIYPTNITLAQYSPVRITIVPDEGRSIDTLTVGGTPVATIPEEDENGVVIYEINSVTADTEVAVTFKDGAKANTSILCVKQTVSAKEGEEVTLEGTLYGGGTPLAGKVLTVQITSRSDAQFVPVTVNATTGSEGKFVVLPENLPVGSYQATVAFAGDEGYRASKLTFYINILENQITVVGDFALSRTGGGTLTEGIDYSYEEDDDENSGKGLLTILSDAPITIAMADETASSNDRIRVATTDTNATAHLTLSSLLIDRSSVIFTEGAGSLTDKAQYASVLCVSNYLTQKTELLLEGYSVFKGSVSGNDAEGTNPAEYYAGIYAGDLSIDGEGGLSVTSGAATGTLSYRPHVYGIYCSNFNINGGDLSVSLDLKDLQIKYIADYSEAVGLYAIGGTYEQTGGTVALSTSDKDCDGNEIFQDYALHTQYFKLSRGTFTAENNAYTGEIPGDDKERHPAVYSQSAEITGGNLSVTGASYGLYQCYTGGKAEIGNVTVDLSVYGDGEPLGIVGTSTITSGLFGQGNVDGRSVYGKEIDVGSTIEETTINGKKWYRVKDARGMEVSGGEEGTDYSYRKGAFTLLTDTPMTFTMKPGVQKTSDQILSSAPKGTIHHITFDNVNLDRTDVEVDDLNAFRPDYVIKIDGADLDLKLVGNSTVTGSDKHDHWGEGNYVADNNGIFLGQGKLMVSGAGSLNVKEYWCNDESAGINVGDYVQKGGTVEITCGQENVGNYGLLAAQSRRNELGTTTTGGDGSIVITGGTLRVTLPYGAKGGHSNPIAAIVSDGNMTVAGGDVEATTGNCEGQNTGVWVNENLIVSDGTLKVKSGNAANSSAQNNCSFGIKVIGNAIVTGGTVDAESGDSKIESAAGMSCAGDLKLSGGQITAKGGNSAYSSYGYGLIVMNSAILTGGTLKAIGPDEKTADQALGSVGIFQITSTAHLKIDGATVEATGGDVEGESFGIWSKGHTQILSGNLKAVGGKSLYSNSCGLHNDTDSVVEISGGTCEFTGGQAGNKSTGLFASAVSGGIDCQISGGTVTFKGGTATESYGAYLYNKLVVSGGKISASAAKKPIDCNTSSITGGSFAVGDTAANTVYGLKPASGYGVAASGDATYPYTVKSTGGSGGSGGGGGSSQTTVPVTGTKEKSGDGKATYVVTGTTQSGGQTVAEVTYKAPEGSQKNASSVTIPANVTLEDGSKAVVTQVADSAFSGNKKITKVTIPATVEEIGSNAFAGCSSLKTVNVKGSSLVNIKQGAFKNCKKLTAVTIGKNVKSIGKNAFAGDTKLKKVTFKTTKITKAKMGKNAFKNISKKAVIYYPKSLKGKNLTAFKKALKKAGVPKTVKYKKK